MNKSALESFYNLTNFINSGLLDQPQKASAYETKRALLAEYPDLRVIDKAFFAYEIKGAEYPAMDNFLFLVTE
jgi:hypothetical protein